MSLMFENGPLAIVEPVLEEKSEYRLETEVYLPDYLPDIQKLLRTEIIPRVETRDIIGGRITVEGEAEIRILYKASDSEKVSCVTVMKEFSHTVAVSDPDADYNITTKTAGVINSVRASGPRRITVKAEIVTDICAAINTETEVAVSAGEGLEAMVRSICALSHASGKSRQFRITEELELSESAEPISSLLYTDAITSVDDVRVMAGKCVMKGELLVRCTYTSDDDDCSFKDAEFRFPLSQIVDIDDADEATVCDADFEVVTIYAEAENNSDGKAKLVDCEVVINANVHAYATSEYDIITDAFSPLYEIALDYTHGRYVSKQCCNTDSKVVRGELESDKAISCIVSIAASPSILRLYTADGCMKIEGIVTADAIYRTEDGELVSKKAELPFEFGFPYTDCDTEVRCDASATVCSLSYNISGGNLVELRAEVSVKAATQGVHELRAVSGVTVLGDKERREGYPITLYFAEENETVWEIAKRYGGSMKEIMTENSLSSEKITEPTMLIIPSL